MPLTDPQVIDEIKLYSPHAHDEATRASWDEIDLYYKREAEVKLPEAVEGETGDLASLKRLLVRTNFAKTIINSTVTMAMASGIKATSGGQEDKAAATLFTPVDTRRLIRWLSRFGAAWLQVLENDKVKPYRVHKPHVARRVMMTEDPERERGVLVMQTFERRQPQVQGGHKETYHVARWYEWDDERTRVWRRDFVSFGGDDWRRRQLENGRWQASFPYMPWVYVPNREEDTIPEQSDVLDGIEIFKQYDALRVKFLKALEDESFRQIFLANVGEEAAKAILAAGGVNVWYAKNKVGENSPEMQVASPADQRQFLEGLKDLVDSLATVTRTSVLELNERPVQDIPAQTLRVLYGPQIERVTETTEHVNPALSRAASIILGRDVTLTLKPKLPISEDKEHQNKKGLLDSNAYSIRQMLMDQGYTEQQAERIFRMRLEELRRINNLEVAMEEDLMKAEADQEIRVAAAQPPSETNVI